MNKDLTTQFLLFIIVVTFLFLIGSRNLFSFILLIIVGLMIWLNLKKKPNLKLSSLAKLFNVNLFNKKLFDQDERDQVQYKQYFDQMNETAAKFTKAFIYVPVAIVLLFIFFKSIVIVAAGQTGVYHLFGQVREQELSSGFHLVFPLADVTKMSIRTEEYTMSVAYGEGQRPQADAIKALTKEGLTVDLDITVFYHLDESTASDVFRNLGIDYAEKIIRPEVRSAIREVIAQYEAKAIYSEKRQETAEKILGVLTNNLEPRGIVIEQVLLRNVNLPSRLAESIQEKLTAEQEAERMTFVLDRERKEAERKVIEAQGQRDAQTIINQSLTENYLQYLYINSLKDREGTIYVPVNPENGLPLFRNLP